VVPSLSQIYHFSSTGIQTIRGSGLRLVYFFFLLTFLDFFAAEASPLCSDGTFYFVERDFSLSPFPFPGELARLAFRPDASPTRLVILRRQSRTFLRSGELSLGIAGEFSQFIFFFLHAPLALPYSLGPRPALGVNSRSGTPSFRLFSFLAHASSGGTYRPSRARSLT